MLLYKTIRREGEFYQVIERSKFTGYAKPVQSREEAEMFFDEIRKKHRDATHNVPAMVLGEKMEIQWSSDDGEPKGTSGVPMLQMMMGEGLTNLAVMVTRYFGGIKLGTGGLVRAYTNMAKGAIEEAGICGVEMMQGFSCTVDYSSHNKLLNLLDSWGGTILDTVFTDQVEMIMKCPPENFETIKFNIANATDGKASIENVTMSKEKVDLI